MLAEATYRLQVAELPDGVALHLDLPHSCARPLPRSQVTLAAGESR